MTDRRKGYLKSAALYLAANVALYLVGLPFEMPMRLVAALLGGLLAGLVVISISALLGWIKP